MKISQRKENWAMPIDAPAYSPMPAHYKDTIFQTVFFRTHEDNVARILPSPLKPAPGGLCAVLGIKVGWCSHWGPFNEVGVVVQSTFRGKIGWYLTCLFLNSSDPIAPGREIWGCPKKYAEITVEHWGSELTTTCVRAGVPMIQINSRIIAPAKEEEVPLIFPMYVLKIIPKVGSSEPEVKQLNENPPPYNVKIHALYKGVGTVRFEPTTAGDFWQLTPIEMLSSWYQVCDYSQGHGKVIYDYLKEK